MKRGLVVWCVIGLVAAAGVAAAEGPATDSPDHQTPAEQRTDAKGSDRLRGRTRKKKCDPCPDRRQALLFSVRNLLEISEFRGQLISYQRLLGEGRALRVAVGLSLDATEEQHETELGAVDFEKSYDTTDWDHEGSVGLHLLFYRGESPLRVYYGGGPVVAYSDQHYEDLIYGVSGDEIEYRYYGYDGSEWRLGLQGILGVQWDLSETFALHAEYGATARYRLGERTYSYYRTDSPGLQELTETRIRSPQFLSDGVLVGLSVYF
jgi:hypothetical protein